MLSAFASALLLAAAQDGCVDHSAYDFDLAGARLREVEIIRLHEPGIDERLARRLVEVVGMVRELDLKKPPSIAESIDWARALLLLGADDIDAKTFTRTMSIIVKHRTDLDLVAERVGMRLGGGISTAGS